jgi:hypothetical protein
MNNEAFSQLVRERVSTSTREWVRETVAADFKRKKQRRGGNDDGSSDDDDDNDDSKPRRKKGKRFLDEVTEEDKQTEQHLSQYRDRAKERREGTIPPDDEDEAPEQSEDDVLEDDLEMALRRSLQKKQLAIKKKNTSDPAPWTIPETREQAMELILQNNIQTQSPLGQALLSYWQAKLYQQQTGNSMNYTRTNAGKLVQRTTLLFDMGFPDPRNRQRSWLVPTEQTFATRNEDQNDDDERILKASPLPASMIQQIKESLQKYRMRLEQATTTRDQQAATKHNNGSGDTDNSDDDDIFASIGSDYQPKLTILNEEKEQVSNGAAIQKVSVFDTNTQGYVTTNQQVANAPAQATRTRLTGFLTNSGNDFGEDFDNDFDGRAEWEDDAGKDKSPKKGKKRRRKKNNEDDDRSAQP